METRNYSQTRQHLADVMDQVNNDQEPILVTRQSGKPVVMMSLDTYNALEETAYLLRSPKNAQRLLGAILQLRQGGGSERLLTPDAD